MRLVIALAAASSVVAGAGACGSKSAPPGPTCADVAQQAVDGMVKRAKDQALTPGLMPDVVAKITEQTTKLEAFAPRWRALLANHCAADKWPRAVIACHATVTTWDELRACRAQLPELQQVKVQKDELDLFGSGVAPPPGFTASSVPKSPAIDRLEAELRQLNAQLGEAVKKLTTAMTETDRAAAKDEVHRLQGDMQRVNEKLAGERKLVDRDPIAVNGDKMRRAYEAVSVQVDLAMQAVAAAKTDDERRVVAARLQALLAQQADLASWASPARTRSGSAAAPAAGSAGSGAATGSATAPSAAGSSTPSR